MDFTNFTAKENDQGRRIDKILKVIAEQESLSNLYKYMRKGLVRVNGKKVKADYRVNAGDTIQLASFILAEGNESPENEVENLENKADKKSDKKTENKSENVKLNILFENENFLVINKPYNVSVHGNKDSLDALVRSYVKTDSLSFSPGPLHRLDKKTSGILVFSKSLAGARWFTENISEHTISKVYCAVLEGKLEEEECWNDWVRSKEESGNFFHTVECSSEKKGPEWKNAQSCARPLAYGLLDGKTVTLAEIKIKTGRKHQIRVQSSFHGYPLAGDISYGGHKLPQKLSRDFYLAAVNLKLSDELKNNNLGFPSSVKISFEDEFFDIIKYCYIK